jgi:hypothetical protein
MIHGTCPCCGIDRLPQLEDCTFRADCAEEADDFENEADDFDELLGLRAEIASLRAGLANLRTGLAEAQNTNLVDYIDALLGDA